MNDTKSKKKHKKKRKNDDVDEHNTDEDLNSVKMSSFDAPEQHEKAVEDNLQSPHHKKKKKKKHSEVIDGYNEDAEHEDTTANSGELVACKKDKKHKKKNKHQENTTEIDGQEKNAGQKSFESVDSNSSEEQKKSNKKKKKHSKEKMDEENFTESKANDNEVKTSENSTAIIETENHDTDDQLSTSLKCKKKKSKKHKRKLSETSSQDQVLNSECTEPSNSKKVKLQSNLDSCVEQSELNDGIHLKESKQEVKSGQWSSAELGDTNRQNKFMRLLGGFKKGTDSTQMQKKFGFGLQSKGDLQKRSGGNFAMNKQQQDTYTKNLESDYERAMGMNLNRGIGLGFQKPPDEGKKFYIDTKSSKSVKFDD